MRFLQSAGSTAFPCARIEIGEADGCCPPFGDLHSIECSAVTSGAISFPLGEILVSKLIERRWNLSKDSTLSRSLSWFLLIDIRSKKIGFVADRLQSTETEIEGKLRNDFVVLCDAKVQHLRTRLILPGNNRNFSGKTDWQHEVMVSAPAVANLWPNAANDWTPVCVDEQILHVEAALHQSPIGVPSPIARRRKSVDLQSKELRIKELFPLKTANDVAAIFSFQMVFSLLGHFFRFISNVLGSWDSADAQSVDESIAFSRDSLLYA